MTLHEFVKRMVGQAIEDIHTALPAKVEKFDPTTLRGDVVPLVKWRTAKDTEPEPMPLILDVPFWMPKAGPFILRMPVKKGDVVLLVFSERALDFILVDGQPQDPQFNRRHALDDAMALPGLLHQGEDNLPGEHGADVLLLHRETGVKIFMAQDGTVRIENPKAGSHWEMKPSGETNFKTPPHTVKLIPGGAVVVESPEILLGSDGAEEGVPLGITLKEWLDGHTHEYSWTSSGGSGTTSPPTSESPKPSEKVMVE